MVADRHSRRSGNHRGADDAGSRPQVRRKAASDAEADNARTAVHHCAGFGDGGGELCRQIAAVAAANDVHARTRRNAGFESQTNNDDHVIPTLNSKSKYQGAPDPAIPAERWRSFTAAANPTAVQKTANPWSRLAVVLCPCLPEHRRQG